MRRRRRRHGRAGRGRSSPPRVSSAASPAPASSSRDDERRDQRQRRPAPRTGRTRVAAAPPSSALTQRRHELRPPSRNARAGSLASAAPKHRVQLRRDRRHLGVHVRGRLGRRALRLERPSAGQELERDDRERVPVAGRRRPLAPRLLGREVAGGTEHRPGHRQRVADPRRSRSRSRRRVDAPSLVEQQVPGLDVAVDDARRGAPRRAPPPPARATRAPRRPAAARRAEPVLERPAVEVLHDDERPVRPTRRRRRS